MDFIIESTFYHIFNTITIGIPVDMNSVDLSEDLDNPLAPPVADHNYHQARRPWHPFHCQAYFELVDFIFLLK